MTIDKTKSLIADSVVQKEIEFILEENSRQHEKLGRLSSETGQEICGLKEQMDQLGGFIEQAYPSMTKWLWEKFNMETIASRVYVRRDCMDCYY